MNFRDAVYNEFDRFINSLVYRNGKIADICNIHDRVCKLKIKTSMNFKEKFLKMYHLKYEFGWGYNYNKNLEGMNMVLDFGNGHGSKMFLKLFKMDIVYKYLVIKTPYFVYKIILNNEFEFIYDVRITYNQNANVIISENNAVENFKINLNLIKKSFANLANILTDTDVLIDKLNEDNIESSYIL